MKCKSCGAKLKKDAQFCGNCGCEITKNNKTLTKTARAIIACACCVVILITGTIGGLYFKNSGGNKNEGNNNYVALEEGFTDVKVTDEKSALEAIDSVKDVIGIDDVNSELKTERVYEIDNTTYYRFQQYQNDIPVYGKTICIAVNSNDDACALVSNAEKEHLTLDYKITQEEAKHIIKDKLSITDEEMISYGQCIYENECSYMFLSSFEDENEQLVCGFVFVSGIDGKIKTISTTHYANNIEYNKFLNGQKDKQYFDVDFDDENYYLSDSKRIIYGYEAESDNCWLFFSKVKSAHQISWNKDIELDSPSAVDAVANVKKAYDYYKSQFNYVSTNGDGNCCINVVDGFGFSSDNKFIYDNATSKSGADENGCFYTQINIGKKTIGEECTMSAFLDVIAHEYTHAVVYYTANLGGNKASESLNEAYSDIMGEVIENYVTKENDWKIGKNIRDIKNTKLKSINDYNNKKDAHDNCQIIDYVAYLMNNGCNGSQTNLDMMTIGSLWFNSLYLLTSNSTFEQCRNAVELSARIMLNNKELTVEQYNCVKEAFDAVGIEKIGYTYKSTVKNDFNLKVLNSKGTDNLTFKYEIYDFSDASKKFTKFFDVIKKDYEDFKIDEGTLTKGTKSFSLSDGLYVVKLSENATNGQAEPIMCKIVVDGSNKNSLDKVEIRTDFDEIITVVLNDTSEKKNNDSAYKEYAKVYNNLLNKYGEMRTNPKYDNTFLLGINYAELIDFNNDGIDELYVVYAEDGKYPQQYTFEVWGYKGDTVQKLDYGEPYGTDGGVKCVAISELKGQKYIISGGTDSFSFSYYHGFNGNDFGVVKSLEAEFDAPSFKIDGKDCSEEEYYKTCNEWEGSERWYTLIEDSYSDDMTKVRNIISKTEKSLGINKDKSNDKEIQLSESKLRSIADDEIGNVALFEYHDYDHNGTKEAFFVSAKKDEGGYCVVPWEVYYISCDGNTKLIHKESDYSCYFDDSNKKYFTADDSQGFFCYDKGGYGSGWLTDIYSVVENKPKKLNSSGIQGLYQKNDGTFYTTQNEYVEGGGHLYPEYELIYNSSSCEFSIGDKID